MPLTREQLLKMAYMIRQEVRERRLTTSDAHPVRAPATRVEKKEKSNKTK